MSKKTTVGWLCEQLSSSKFFYYLMEDINNRNTVEQSDIFEQAKEMEEKQIIEFAKWCDNNYNTLEVYNVADLLELYNKTFKSE